MAIELNTDRLTDNPYQPRQHYDAESTDALAESIERKGQLQTPTGRLVNASGGHVPHHESEADVKQLLQRHADWKVQLAFGHRRLRAHRQLGRLMPVEVKRLNDEEMDMQAWDENRAREDLTPLEQAQAIADRIERYDWTQAEAGEELGLARSTVSNKLRLLKLPSEVLEHLTTGDLSERQARALIPAFDLSDDEQHIAEEHLTRGSVTQTPRHYLQRALGGATSDWLQRRVKRMKDRIKGIAKKEEQPATEDAGAGEGVEDDLDAEELAARLKEGHGIPASRLRGAEDLRAALRDAEAVAAGEHLEDPHDLVETWMGGREEVEDRGPKVSHAPAQEPQAEEEAFGTNDTPWYGEDDAPSGDALPAEADLGDSEEGRIYDAFRADLLSKLEDVPRWMLLRYLSAAAPTGHNREKGERLRGRVADAMVPRRRYVQQGDPKMTRVNLCDWARGSDLYDWGRRLDPRNGEAAGDGAAEEEPAVAGGGMT